MMSFFKQLFKRMAQIAITTIVSYLVPKLISWLIRKGEKYLHQKSRN